MKQKEIFLRSEGDKWLERNKDSLENRILPDQDPLLLEIQELKTQLGIRPKILEIGCSNGTRLAWLRNNFNADCYGVDPSLKAVSEAVAQDLKVCQGTADKLPFDDQSFDVVIFGFCLYLCDPDDLFRIASSADRVLRAPGWLLIMDFYSPSPRSINYHHLPGVKSYKMDFRSMFHWHPAYECVTHKIRHHSHFSYTDEENEWVAVSIMRKQNKAF